MAGPRRRWWAPACSAPAATALRTRLRWSDQAYPPSRVVRLLVGERLFHLALPGGVGREGEPLGPGTATVEVDDLLGHGGHCLADPVALLGPVLPAHPGDAGCLPARVLGDGGELVGGDVQAVAALVGDHQVLPLHPGHGAGDQALEAADAVLVVDDVVAFGEVAVVLPFGGS